MAICRRCGAEVGEGKAFCFNCGAQMDVSVIEAAEPTPEFADTLNTRDPAQEDPAPPATTPALAQPLAVVGAGTSQPESVNRDHQSAAARRSFMSRRVWVAVVLLLLLVILAVVALTILAD
jgi:hypothetical protein